MEKIILQLQQIIDLLPDGVDLFERIQAVLLLFHGFAHGLLRLRQNLFSFTAALAWVRRDFMERLVHGRTDLTDPGLQFPGFSRYLWKQSAPRSPLRICRISLKRADRGLIFGADSVHLLLQGL